MKAWRADPYGNLLFRGTAQNFNPECAMAAKFTIAQVEELLPLGGIPPEAVHLSGIHVKVLPHDDAHFTVHHGRCTLTRLLPIAVS